MTHLYVATRSDNPSVLKVGRSSNPDRRCVSLQCSHCFEVRPLAVWPDAGEYETAVHRALDALREPGPGREWFRASPGEVYSAVALAMRGKRRRSLSPARSIDDMARDLLGRLETVSSPGGASTRGQVDDLARRLYGVYGERVLSHAGLMRVRTRVGDGRLRENGYFYTVATPMSGRSYVAIASREDGLPSDLNSCSSE